MPSHAMQAPHTAPALSRPKGRRRGGAAEPRCAPLPQATVTCS